jgi:hypothetical protein
VNSIIMRQVIIKSHYESTAQVGLFGVRMRLSEATESEHRDYNKATFEGLDFSRLGLIELRLSEGSESGRARGVIGEEGREGQRRNHDSCHDPPQRVASHLTSSTYNLNHCTISFPIW